MSSRINALKSVSKKKPNSEELQAVFDEIFEEKQDRSCAMLSAAAAEWVLLELVKSHMIPLSNTMKEGLFERDGPLSSFSKLIRVAHGFGIIDGGMARELHYIREIRNCFAHSRTAVKFNTPEVAAVCELFNDHFSGAPTSWGPARDKFLGAITANLETILKKIKPSQLAHALKHHEGDPSPR